MESTRSTIVKRNILGSLAIKCVSIGVQLLMVPLTLGYLETELYGVWLTLSQIVLWINYFDIGFTLGLKNRLAEAVAREDWRHGKALVSTTYVMVGAIFVPLAAILCLVMPYVDWCRLLHVSSQYLPDIVSTMQVLIICFSLQTIVNVFTSVAQAFQQTALSVSFPTISNAIALAVIWVLTRCCPASLVALAWVIAVIPIVAVMLASLYYYRGRFRSVAPSLAAFDRSLVGSLYGLGVKFFLIQVQLVVFFQCTNLLIAYLSGPDAVSVYNVAYKYLSTGLLLFVIVLNPLWPAFTDAYVKQDYEWMRSVYRRMRRLCLILCLLTLVMVVISPWVYRLWIGDKLSVPLSLSVLIGLYMIINQWYQLHVFIVNGIGCIRLQTYVCLVGLFLHLPFSLILGHWIGYISVVYSMLLITAIYGIVITIQVRKILSHEGRGVWLQ